MLGLILKDGYTMAKQTKIFILLTIVFAVIPSEFMFGYSIFYAAMLPITALAYDERAKWNKLAGMMPYSTGEMVGSKYVMGYFSVGVVFVLVICSRAVLGAVNGTVILGEEIAALIVVTCVAFIVQAINLPIMFWIGVEKGRMVFILFTVIAIVSTMAVFEESDLSQVQMLPISQTLLVVGMILVTVVLNIISFFIAKVLYEKKDN